MIKITVKGRFTTGWMDEVDTRLQSASRRLLASLAERVKRTEQNSIMFSKDPDGKPILPLSRPRRKGHNQSNIPRYDTGQLFESIKIEYISLDKAEVGSEEPKAIWQNLGTHHIPPRPFIGANDDDVSEAYVYDFLERDLFEENGMLY